MDEKTKARYLGDIEYFTAKMQQDKSSMLFLPLASAYINLRKYDEAKQVLFDGLDANPDVAMAKTFLAQAYIGLSQLDDAKGLLTEIRVLDSANYLAEKLLGDIYREESDYKRALVSYKNAYAAAPEDDELKDIIQNLLSESGIDEHDLLDDRPMGLEEEELLDSLGEELAEEVRQEIGEAKQVAATDEEVRQTVDEIVGATDEDSLDIYAEEDSSAEAFEMEEESLASLSDEIIPTKSLIDFEDITAEGDDDEEEIPDGLGDVSDMAAELGADFGLDIPSGEDSSEPSDISDETEIVDVSDDAVTDELSSDGEETFDVSAIMGETAEEALGEAAAASDNIDTDGGEPEEDFDVSAIMGEEVFSAADVPDDSVEQSDEDFEIPDMQETADIGESGGFEAFAQETGDAEEQPEEVLYEEEVSEEHTAETADEIIAHDDAVLPVIDTVSEELGFSEEEMQMMQEELSEESADEAEQSEPVEYAEPDEVFNMSPEDEKIISDAREELTKEAKIDDELAILFAMEELEDRAKHGEDPENVSAAAEDLLSDVKSRYPEGLDDETYEQVSRLENLLEIIKNNAK